MIDKDMKFIFIQAPKTGTTSIARWLAENHHSYGDTNLYRKHVRARDWASVLDPDVFDNAFKFMFVRNPWDRLVSDYHYLFRLAVNPPARLKDRPHTRASNSLFTDHKISNFTDFVNYIIDNIESEVIFPVVYLKKSMFSNYACRYTPSDRRGPVVVDQIGRFESLQSDFDEICEKLEIPCGILPHDNSAITHARRLGLSARKEWQSYYTDDTFSKIAEFYVDDINRFGYEHNLEKRFPTSLS